MLFLLLRILFTLSFSHLIRLSQARTRRPMAAAAVNYVVAAVGCVIWVMVVRGGASGETLFLGSVAGVIYVVSMVMLLPAMRASGVAVVGAVTQLSMMMPVAVAVWRFREYPSALQTAGIIATLLALPLLSATSAMQEERPRGLSPLILLLFMSTGSSQVVMKEFASTRPGSDLPLYSAALFVAATISTVVWMAATGDTGRPNGKTEVPSDGRLIGEWPIGIALGAVNLLQLVCLLLALRSLPAVIVFPVSAALGIVFNAVVSLVVWRERPSRGGWLGIGLAVMAVILLSWK
jgi:drug/metabolite transporter (DMT)-like permease